MDGLVFDFVIVGAGSAGSVAAAHLARRVAPGASVALLEAGNWARPQLWEFMPRGAFRKYVYDYGPVCHGQTCRLLGGRTLGGSAAVNGGAYTRVAPGDLPWLSPEDVVSSYESLEADMPRVLVSPLLEELPQVWRTLVESMQDSTHGALRWRVDPHERGAPTARISGYYRSQERWSKTHRVSSLGRANHATYERWSPRMTPYNKLIRQQVLLGLQVFPNVTAKRVIVRRGIAVGVEAAGTIFHARSEILLCTGAVETAALLHASGLSRRNKAGVSVFPFQDHRAVWFYFDINGPFRRVDDFLVLTAFLNASWPTTSSSTSPAEFELYITNRHCLRKGRAGACLELGAILLHPSSPGHLYIADGDPPTKSIELELGAADVRKFERLADYLRHTFENTLQRLGIRQSVDTWDPLLVMPSNQFRDVLHTRMTTWNHATGTCPVGVTVDERFRFRGVQRLRVADASVLPISASGHTDAAAQLLGYLAARYMEEDWAGSVSTKQGSTRTNWAATSGLWAPLDVVHTASREAAYEKERVRALTRVKRRMGEECAESI